MIEDRSESTVEIDIGDSWRRTMRQIPRQHHLEHRQYGPPGQWTNFLGARHPEIKPKDYALLVLDQKRSTDIYAEFQRFLTNLKVKERLLA